MSLFNREKAFETKLKLLEQRLVRVERFVEMRFCESVRDLSISNVNSPGGSSSDNCDRRKRLKREMCRITRITVEPEKDERYYDDDYKEEDYVPIRTRSGRSTRRPARLSASVTPTSTPKRNKVEKETLRVQVIKLQSAQNDNDATFKDEKSTGNVSAEAEPLVIKSTPLSQDDPMARDENEDEYFIFPQDDSAEDNGPQNTNKATATDNEELSDNAGSQMNPVEDDEWRGASDSESTHQPKKKRVNKKTAKPKGIGVPRGKYRKKAKTASIIPGSKLVLQNSTREECSVCHKFFKKELIIGHMKFHTKERHLKCSFSNCDRTFFNKSMLTKHEKLHQPEKYAKQCRLCDKKTIETGKMLVHERSCIRRALEQGKHVDPALLEEIRRRSQGIELKWPNQCEEGSESKKMKKCAYCSEYFVADDYCKHVKTHATWVCTLCDNSYINKEGLIKHMRRIHGAATEEGASHAGRQLEDSSGNELQCEKKPLETIIHDGIQPMPIEENENSEKNPNEYQDDVCKVTDKQHSEEENENRIVNFTLVDAQYCHNETRQEERSPVAT